MTRHKVPLLVVSVTFLTLALYLLFSAPDEALLAQDASGTSIPLAFLHPCPYADILGLDEHSPNPHGAGGHLPPLPNAQPHAERRQFDPTSVTHDDAKATGAAPTPVDDEHYISRSDFDTQPPVPPSHSEL